VGQAQWLSVAVAAALAGCMGVSDPALVTVSLAAGPPSLPSDGGGGGGLTDVGAVDAGAMDAGSPDGGVDACAGVSCELAARTQAEVCAATARLLVRKAAGDGFSVSTMTCDPGSLSRDALDDGLARLNYFRWLVGLGPTTDSAEDDEVAQKCALVSAWNPAGPGAHSPPPSATCYTPEGALGAASSNIAWGAADLADAIDLWMIDYGNETTFGHRRWLLNPPLEPVGLGHYRGGTNDGTASCIRVFGGSGTGPTPNWLAFPPPGYVPQQFALWHWTVHGNIPLDGATASVRRASDGADMPVQFRILSGFYGQAAAALLRDGWNPVAGETYHVTITGRGGAGTIEYDVKPVNCQ